MAPETARLRRLLRLEKVRAMAKQAAAAEAATAESTLAQLDALVARTATMTGSYRVTAALPDGMALRQLSSFVGGLTGVMAVTRGDAERARQIADRKQQDLAYAERRRSAVEDRAAAARQALAHQRRVPALGSRRAIGTDLE